MVEAIRQTFWDDKLKIYKNYRKEHEIKLLFLEKERLKIMKRKKNKKEKARALRNNSVERLSIICAVIRQTYLHYKKQYFENDFYREIRLEEARLQDVEASDRERVKKENSIKKKVTIVEEGEKSDEPPKPNLLQLLIQK